MHFSVNEVHKAFESRVRLGIISALAVNEEIDFTALKELLDVTDGNLATHLKKLEELEFIRVDKLFIENKPNTRYSISKKGRDAFDQYLHIIEKIIKAQKNE